MQKQINTPQTTTNTQVVSYFSKNDERNIQYKNAGYLNNSSAASPFNSLITRNNNFLSAKFPLSINPSLNSSSSRIDLINKKKLVLDLDETLVFADTSPLENIDEERMTTVFGKIYKIYIRIRPGAIEFIEQMNKYFELFIFTASAKEYADTILEIIDKNHLIKNRFYQDSITKINQSSVKNLDLLKCNLKDVIIVDNDPKAYSWHQKNGLPISTWNDNRNDQDLRLISKLLIFLSKVDDVRNYIPNFVSNSTICLENIDKVIHKYEIVRDSESSSLKNLLKMCPDQIKKGKKEKIHKKLKHAIITEYFAPDEFVNAFNSDLSSIKKINEIKAFEVKKSSFSHYDKVSTDSENEKKNLSTRSFVELNNQLSEIKQNKINEQNGKRNQKSSNPLKQENILCKPLFSNSNNRGSSSSSFTSIKRVEDEYVKNLKEEEPKEFLYFD